MGFPSLDEQMFPEVSHGRGPVLTRLGVRSGSEHAPPSGAPRLVGRWTWTGRSV